MGDRTRGLYRAGKFKVERLDGRDRPGDRHHDCFYFVLDVDHDPHAIPALRAYIASAREEGWGLLLCDDLEVELKRREASVGGP